MCAQDQKIATCAMATEPLKSFVEITAAAHKGKPELEWGHDVLTATQAEVLVRVCLAHAARTREKEDKSENANGFFHGCSRSEFH
jgi:hypothetical protein